MIVSGFDPGWANLANMRFAVDEAKGRLVYLSSKLTVTTPKHKINERTVIIVRGIAEGLEGEPGLCGIEEQLRILSKEKGNRWSDHVRHVVSMIRAQALQAGWEPVEVKPVHMRTELAVPRNGRKGEMAKMLKMLTKGVPDGLSEHEYDAGAAAYAVWRRHAVQLAMEKAKAK